MTSVMVVQRVVPPYRVPFFRRLAGASSIELVVAYGDPAEGSALVSVTDPPGVPTLRLDNVHVRGGRLVWQRGLPGAIRAVRPDVVIAEFNPRIVSNVAALARTRIGRTAFVWWGHGLSPDSSPMAARIRLALARRAEALLVYGPSQAEWFVERGLHAERVVVAGNAIATETIENLRDPWDVTTRSEILYVGRLIPEKKVDLLLRGFARAIPSLPTGLELSIVGEGPERPRLEELVEALDIGDRVRFHGALYEEAKLAERFNHARFTVSPGGIGLAALHTLAYGVPPLVTRDEPHGPEVDALEDGENAVFVASNDVEAWARALADLARDDAAVTRLARRAREPSDDTFTLDGMVRGFERAVRLVRPG